MKRIFIFCVCAMCLGCSIDPAQLTGRWQAVAFYEEGVSVQTPLENVNLSFDTNGGYQFNSMGYYREAGHFRSSMKYLYLSDTSVQPTQDRMLKVLFLSADTLKLQMNKGGKNQTLFLSKQH